MKLANKLFLGLSLLSSVGMAFSEPELPKRDAIVLCRCAGDPGRLLYAKVIRISDGKVIIDDHLVTYTQSWDCNKALTSVLACKN